MGHDKPEGAGNCGPDPVLVEAELTRLCARWRSATEEVSGTVPDDQLRALMIFDDSGALSAGRLAAALGVSRLAASRLCNGMAAAGLLRFELVADAGREITLAATATGNRLAGWIRGRRRAVLAQELRSMSADGRRALALGLSELAVRPVRPRRDAAFQISPNRRSPASPRPGTM